MKKVWGILLLAALLLAAVGCGSKTYRNGVYEGRSSVYEGAEDGSGAGYGVVTLTIENGAISACEYHTYEPDGTLKDSEYGKQNGEIANRDFYNKAQRAVMACERYAQQLTASGKLSEVDAISGATISYNEFEEAVRDALSKAEE